MVPCGFACLRQDPKAIIDTCSDDDIPVIDKIFTHTHLLSHCILDDMITDRCGVRVDRYGDNPDSDYDDDVDDGCSGVEDT